MKTTKCCGRCYYSSKPFFLSGYGRFICCQHPQEKISDKGRGPAQKYFSERHCFYSRSHWIGRVQNSDTSWRPDVPIWVLRIGGLFFRLAWKTLSNRILFQAIALKNADKRMTLLQRWHMFVLENYAYWDQYDEMSDEDRKGIVK